jgi:hypothetical protein
MRKRVCHGECDRPEHCQRGSAKSKSRRPQSQIGRTHGR